MRTPALLLLATALTACGGGSDDKPAAKDDAVESPLRVAYDACKNLQVGNPLGEDDMPAARLMTVDDESLVVDGFGDQFASGQVATCLLDELDVSAGTLSMIESTTSMMGRQTGSWGDYEATWSFHPDNGLDMVIEVVE